MSKHNYINPAFCQNSEFYPIPPTHNEKTNTNDGAVYNLNLSSRSFNAQAAMLTNRNVLQLQNIHTCQPLDTRHQHGILKNLDKSSCSGRYALVPVEELRNSVANNRYAIMPEHKRCAKSQENLDYFGSHRQISTLEEPHFFNDEISESYTSLPPNLNHANYSLPHVPKIKHAFSSDFGSKSFLIVDKYNNQRYQMVPTAEDEELVDDNQEIIQMHNGRAHRYAVIPAENDDDEIGDEEETCLSASDLNHSMPLASYDQTYKRIHTSTPQRRKSTINLASQVNTPLKNPKATRMLHELLSTPPKILSNTSKLESLEHTIQGHQTQFYNNDHLIESKQTIISAHPHSVSSTRFGDTSYYETAKSVVSKVPAQQLHVKLPNPNRQSDRTMAVIIPRVADHSNKQLEDYNDVPEKTVNSSYPRKVANATITLAVVSLMLVFTCSMNVGVIIYMIAHFGKSFYLQYGLVASLCGVGLGFLGFRSRHCTWLPNRSYTSGYILVTIFSLLKCSGLLVILVLDPFPGLPLHDVTTGIILGLSTFTMFFIGLGVIGTIWCYRPPPDNRVNVI